MANTIMPKYRQAEMGGLALNLADAGVNLIFIAVDANQYAADDEDEFVSDILAAAEVSRTGALQNKVIQPATFAGGVVQQPARLTCDPIALPDTADPDTPEHVYLAHDTGVAATSRLLVRWDTAITGFPLTQDGVNDVIQAATANGLFGL